MKKGIVPAAALAIVAAALTLYAALLPSYGEKMRASVLRAPSVNKDSVTTTPVPTSNPGYVLVSSGGFEVPVSSAGTTGMAGMADTYIYDYGEWADMPYTIVYSVDGNEKMIRPYDLAEYAAVGWTDEIPAKEGSVDLKNSITDYISGIPGDWGVYINRMDTNEYI